MTARNFHYCAIAVWNAKSEKERIPILPEGLSAPLQDHLQGVKRTHEKELEKGYRAVYLPSALERKSPNAHPE